jgi:hypothetical protein
LQVAAAVQKPQNKAVGIRRADYVTHLYSLKLELALPTSGGDSVGIVRSRTQATEFVLCVRGNRKLRIRCFVEGLVEIIEKSLARSFELRRGLRKQVKWVLRVGDEVYEDKSCH